MAESIEAIDAHHHIWRLADLAWLSGPPVPRIFGPYEAIRRDYTVDEFRRDLEGSNVVKSIYVQTNWPPGGELTEAQWVQSVADAAGWPHACVAYADLADPNVDTLLDKLCKLPTVRGVRQQLHWHENPQYRFASRPNVMNDPAWRKGMTELANRNLIFELQVFAGQMQDGAELARAFPKVNFVLEHAGMLEDLSPAGWELWRRGMKLLAAQPNVFTKLSGLGTFVHAYPAEVVSPIIRETVSIFGAGRCMYGSNFPIEKLWTSYKALNETFRQSISYLSLEEQRAILHDTAAQLYRI
ncbi:amidohydrolase [Bradyrhizobium neotropicale]|uniref:amidohydrolase family protein n=1 Tax=Bradyrhizobium neotropicale TaxID=1497615 RepID=UPI001AD725A3|nr:amidohydrolase family protein [Bradyrhizobium neotropicale]MBO4223878.1 amidohydrolase family protein [Bradyrhizobium neotropicale]